MAYFRDEYDDPRLQWDLQDGDWEALPGLRLIDTRGHTQGHQSAIVELPESGTLVLPFDAGDLQENFDEEILPGECCDDEAALRAIQRLKALEASTGRPDCCSTTLWRSRGCGLRRSVTSSRRMSTWAAQPHFNPVRDQVVTSADTGGITLRY